MNRIPPMLQLEGLAKRFTLHVRGGKRIEAFADVGFAVDAGRALVLSGPSGRGKSSVLKCIHRTYRSSAGSIRYRSLSMGAVDLADLDEHRILRLRRGEIGYVTQFLKVLPRVPTVDVVAEPMVSRGAAPEAARAAAEAHLARLGIPRHLFDAFPATFSGGEQQRVNLARAVVARPRLLLLDEPTASLDPRATAVVLAMLRELKADGTAMVAVFHDRETAEGIADDFYRL